MMNFDDILVKLEQVDSLMYSVEGAMIAAAPEDGGAEVTRLHNLVYLLWDQLRQIAEDTKELNGHVKVCNAIYAVNKVDEMRATIERLKGNA